MNDTKHPIQAGREYHEMFDRLVSEVTTLHQANQRRIRIGLRALVIVSLLFMALLFLTHGEKIIILLLWIVTMFALAAYLISVDYANSEVKKALERVTQQEFEELGSVMTEPQLPTIDTKSLPIHELLEQLKAEQAPSPQEIRTTELVEQLKKEQSLDPQQTLSEFLDKLQEDVRDEILGSDPPASATADKPDSPMDGIPITIEFKREAPVLPAEPSVPKAAPGSTKVKVKPVRKQSKEGQA